MPHLSARWVAAAALFIGGAVAASPADAVDVTWSTYGPESALVETTATDLAMESATAATQGSASAHQQFSDGWRDFKDDTGFRPATDPDGADYTCHVSASKPVGEADRDGALNARVYAYVNCNFTSPEIMYKVQFQGHDPASGSFVEHGGLTTCPNTDFCRNAVSYHRTTYACQGSFDHYGVPYGTYTKPDGSRHTLVGDGIDGPHTAGSSFSSYC